MYFPVRHTLGYSHGLILYAPFYAPIRLFVHPFQAYSLALLAMMEVGIVCLYALLRRFQLTFFESLLLTVFFFTSENVVNGSIGVWSQRASVFLIPPILLIGVASFRAANRRARILGGTLTGLLASLLYTHDFYTAHFAMFFAVLAIPAFARTSMTVHLTKIWTSVRRPQRIALAFGVLALLWTYFVVSSGGAEMHVLGLRIASHNWRRPAILAGLSLAALIALRGPRRLAADAARSDPWFRGVAAGGAAGGMAFLWIYLPVILERRTFPESDLLNALVARDPWHAYNSLRAFAVIGVLAFAMWIPWSRADRRTRRTAVWVLAVSAIALLIPIRTANFSIWMTVFRRAPGFGVIRDPNRIIYLYELAAVLAAAWLLTRLPRASEFRAVVAIGLLTLIVADHNREVFDFYRSRAVYRRWVEAPVVIDRSCRSFFIKGASPEVHVTLASHVDALRHRCDVRIPQPLAPDAERLQRLVPGGVESLESARTGLSGSGAPVDRSASPDRSVRVRRRGAHDGADSMTRGFRLSAFAKAPSDPPQLQRRLGSRKDA